MMPTAPFADTSAAVMSRGTISENTRASRTRRLEEKKRRGAIKQRRKRPDED